MGWESEWGLVGPSSHHASASRHHHESECEEWCFAAVCDELNGDVQVECGGCPSSAGCHPNAHGWPSHASVAVTAAGVATFGVPLGPLGASLNLLPANGHGHGGEQWPVDFGALEVAGARWLFHTHSTGVLSVQLICNLPPEVASGRATDLHGTRNSSIVARSHAEESGWCFGGSSCRPIEPSLAARLTNACDHNDPPWAACEPHGVVQEDTDCRRQRHRAAYGEHFLPKVIASAPPSAPPPVQFAHLDFAPGHARGIDEFIGCPSFAHFVTHHVYAHRPLLMRGCASNMPAASRWRDPEHMHRAAGGWRGHSWLRDGHPRDYTYDEFVAGREGNGVYLPWKPLPEALRRDLSLPRVFACAPLLTRGQLITEIHLRMTGGHGDHNGLHFDGGDFFSIQVDGTKRWTMVDPIHALSLYVDHVYPPPGPTFGHQVFRHHGVDVERLPRIVETPVLQAEAHPGDMLYIPQRWFHEIETLPGRNLGLVVQTHFPPPAAIRRASASFPRGPSVSSRELLMFGVRWRSEPGAAHVPEELRPCLESDAGEGADDALEQLWDRAVDSAVSAD